MKKFLYLLLFLPLMAAVVSCDDDDDKNIPQVNLSLDYSGGTLSDGALYVVQGDTISIDSLAVSPVAGTGDARLGNVTYLMDGFPFFSTGLPPYQVAFPTANMSVGNHYLGVNAQIMQVGKSLGWGIFEYKLVVVASQDDLPADQGAGTTTTSVTVTQ